MTEPTAALIMGMVAAAFAAHGAWYGHRVTRSAREGLGDIDDRMPLIAVYTGFSPTRAATMLGLLTFLALTGVAALGGAFGAALPAGAVAHGVWPWLPVCAYAGPWLAAYGIQPLALRALQREGMKIASRWETDSRPSTSSVLRNGIPIFVVIVAGCWFAGALVRPLIAAVLVSAYPDLDQLGWGLFAILGMLAFDLAVVGYAAVREIVYPQSVLEPVVIRDDCPGQQ